MDLKDRKFINNTKQLPGFSGGNNPYEWSNRNPYIAQFVAKDWTNDGRETRVFPAETKGISFVKDNYQRDRIAEIKNNINTSSKKLSNSIANKQYADYKSKSDNWNTANKIASAAPAIIGGIGDIIDTFSYEKSVDDLINEAGRTSYKYGKLPKFSLGYDQINSVNERQVVSDAKKDAWGKGLKSTASGAAAGSAFGPWGALIGGVVGAAGGLIGGLVSTNKARSRANIANIKVGATNNYNKYTALSDQLRLDEIEDMSSYSEGKSPLVDTAFGMTHMAPNARVDKGELIINTNTGNIHKVKRGAGDNALARINPEDAILSKKTGAADYFENTGDLMGALNLNGNERSYANGKYPAFKFGFAPHTIPGILGSLASVYQYFDAASQKIKNSNSYFRNPYAMKALNILGGLTTDKRPIIRQMRDAEARGVGSINMSGLSPAQKYLGRVGLAANSQINIGNIMPELQKQYNANRATYANALNSYGEANRQYLTNAYNRDLDYYSKAHAARQAGKQMGMSNFLSQINQYYANAIKYNQFLDTLSLYRDKKDLDKSNLLNMFV